MSDIFLFSWVLASHLKLVSDLTQKLNLHILLMEESWTTWCDACCRANSNAIRNIYFVWIISCIDWDNVFKLLMICHLAFHICNCITTIIMLKNEIPSAYENSPRHRKRISDLNFVLLGLCKTRFAIFFFHNLKLPVYSIYNQ